MSNPSFKNNTSIKAISDQVSCELKDESVVLSFRDGIYYGMNPVAAHVWGLIQERMTVLQLKEAVLEEFEVGEEECERDLFSFLLDLKQHSLIEIQDV